MADHKLRLRIHSFYTILFKNKKEGTRFLNKGHAKAYSNLKSAVNSFLFLNPKGPANFCACCKNHSTVAAAMLLTIFTAIHQKFVTRRMDENYGF